MGLRQHTASQYHPVPRAVPSRNNTKDNNSSSSSSSSSNNNSNNETGEPPDLLGLVPALNHEEEEARFDGVVTVSGEVWPALLSVRGFLNVRLQ